MATVTARLEGFTQANMLDVVADWVETDAAHEFDAFPQESTGALPIAFHAVAKGSLRTFRLISADGSKARYMVDPAPLYTDPTDAQEIKESADTIKEDCVDKLEYVVRRGELTETHVSVKVTTETGLPWTFTRSVSFPQGRHETYRQNVTFTLESFDGFTAVYHVEERA